SPVAGALGVPPRTFALWQSVGGLLWTVGLILAGHALGASVPNVDRYLLPAISAIVILSPIPVALEIARARRAGRVGAVSVRSQCRVGWVTEVCFALAFGEPVANPSASSVRIVMARLPIRLPEPPSATVLWRWRARSVGPAVSASAEYHGWAPATRTTAAATEPERVL
ncbi:MAG: rane-associated protein, partial [Pseudonocardiales bacterium]|nr:rane-associated protein [Pseudonocardiales bacterium]